MATRTFRNNNPGCAFIALVTGLIPLSICAFIWKPHERMVYVVTGGIFVLLAGIAYLAMRPKNDKRRLSLTINDSGMCVRGNGEVLHEAAWGNITELYRTASETLQVTCSDGTRFQVPLFFNIASATIEEGHDKLAKCVIDRWQKETGQSEVLQHRVENLTHELADHAMTCPLCHCTSDSIKRVVVVSGLFYFVGGAVRRETVTGCPACVRMRADTSLRSNVVTLNFLWPIALMGHYRIIRELSRRGHSPDVVKEVAERAATMRA
jgi:hypothetical protein